MALESALIEEIGVVVEGLLAEGKKPLAEIRRQYPGLHFSQCEAADMTDEPYRKGPRFDLYLVDGSNTCLHLTHDPAGATGLVIALH